MTIDDSVLEILNGKYDFDKIEYFDITEEDRDILASSIASRYFWKIKLDSTYNQFYIDYIDAKINHYLKEEKYEGVDLYKRIKNKIISL